MRRKDREITDKGTMLDIIKENVVCRLGLAVNDRPYVVPMNYGFTWDEGEPLKLFFHSAPVGLKLDMLRQNNLACFEIDGGHQLIRNEEKGEYSFAYASIIGLGRVHFLESAEEKTQALLHLMRHQVGLGEYSFSEADLARTTLFCLIADEVTGKRNLGVRG